MQYNTTQYNKIEHNTIQYNAMQGKRILKSSTSSANQCTALNLLRNR